jgi:hypothetical protein
LGVSAGKEDPVDWCRGIRGTKVVNQSFTGSTAGALAGAGVCNLLVKAKAAQRSLVILVQDQDLRRSGV